MIALCIILGIWALVASYGWYHNLRSAKEWRCQFMVERGCDTKETREYLKKVEASWTSDTR